MSLKRTFPEDRTSRSQEVKIYPTDPCSEGIAVMAYVVLKSALGDLETAKCSPCGTVKSRSAGQHQSEIVKEQLEAYHSRSG